MQLPRAHSPQGPAKWALRLLVLAALATAPDCYCGAAGMPQPPRPAPPAAPPA